MADSIANEHLLSKEERKKVYAAHGIDIEPEPEENKAENKEEKEK